MLASRKRTVASVPMVLISVVNFGNAFRIAYPNIMQITELGGVSSVLQAVKHAKANQTALFVRASFS